MNVHKIYIIAGENSGDYIGSQVIHKIIRRNPNVIFNGIGGPKMELVGLNTLFPMNKINIMGFIEILPRLFELNSLIKTTIQDIIKINPDIIITIDSPGFCLRVIKKVKQKLPNVKAIHIVAPTIWAYKPRRAKIFARFYDYLFSILPFEPPLFQKEGLNTKYIGHPIFEQKFDNIDYDFRKKHNINDNTKLMCITPGSRSQEIQKLLPIFLESAKSLSYYYSNVIINIVAADDSSKRLIEQIIKPYNNFPIFISDHHNKLSSYHAADIALAKSGTNTLEIAVYNTPMIVAYKVNIFTGWLVKWILKIKYVSLINFNQSLNHDH